MAEIEDKISEKLSDVYDKGFAAGKMYEKNEVISALSGNGIGKTDAEKEWFIFENGKKYKIDELGNIIEEAFRGNNK